MSVSKVIFGTETLIDITDTTATAEDVAQGKYFLTASGVLTEGTGTGGGGTPEAHTITIDSLSKSKVGSVSTLPYDFYNGCAVVYNDEIHIFSGGSNGTAYHYKYDGNTWTSVRTLPYSSYYSSAVVYNNEIHLLGGYNSSNSSTKTQHFKFTGSKWTSAGSDLPYEFYDGCVVVYNGEIHILGGANGVGYNHYKWSGSSWSNVGSLPYDFAGGSAVVYNGEIHILGSANLSYTTKHYKWNGTSWTSVSTLPYAFYGASALVYDDEIHILGSSNGSYLKYHYKWNGTSWTQLSNLPYDFKSGDGVLYNNVIHIIGSSVSSCQTNHYDLPIQSITSSNTITTNGIYNIVGSKTETALDKLISNLTANTAGSISVDIDMSATATADKIMQGYTAWVNNVKLTGTATGGGGGGYLQKGTASSATSLTFSNLEIPYSSISKYIVVCIYLNQVNVTSTSYTYWIDNKDDTIYAIAFKYDSTYWGSTLTLMVVSSMITVSGSGNSITFTSSSSSSACFSTTSNAYAIMYC